MPEEPEENRPLRRWKYRFFFDGDDTIAALLLALLGLATLVTFFAVHSEDARGDVLKMSGGLLLLFSAYSASRTLALNRLDQRMGRIIQATEQLRSDSATVRSGGLWTLVDLAISSKSPHERRQRNVIDEVLVTASRDAKAEIDEKELERARRIISAGHLPAPLIGRLGRRGGWLDGRGLEDAVVTVTLAESDGVAAPQPDEDADAPPG